MSELGQEDGEDTSFEVSPEAAAVLEFTSNIGQAGHGELTYITSKFAYVWAGVAFAIAQHTINAPRELRDVDLMSAIYRTVSEIPVPEGPLFLFPRPVGHGDPTDENWEFRAIFLLAHRILSNAGVQFATPHSLLEEASKSARAGYHELISRELITDPIIETTLGIAILSLMPFSIVTRTEKGRLVYTKIQAAMWNYQREIKKNQVETNLTFRVARIAKTLKVGLIAAYNEATKQRQGDEEEPG